jgi:hypothetical protein
MSLTLVDHPADRPEWIRELLERIAERLRDGRAELLSRVEHASDADLVAGNDENWGIGQIAIHLLVSERGMTTIALRLARGEPAGRTGQPRPAAGAVSRDGIAALAAKAEATLDRLRIDFPPEPDVETRAPTPYLGPFNCFGWLVLAALHYDAHLVAIARGTKSAL